MKRTTTVISILTALALSISPVRAERAFVGGDVNSDDSVDLSDAV